MRSVRAGFCVVLSITLLCAAACDSDSPPPTSDASCPPIPETLALEPVVRFMQADAFGFEGSPTLCDLDHDGRLELVAPVANASFPGEIRVIDAIDGTLRFRNRDNHAAYSYPYCVDVNADGTDDVLVAGRGSDVWAISGVDGATLFRLSQENPGLFPAVVGEVGTVASDRVSGTTLFVALRGEEVSSTPGKVLAFDHTGHVVGHWDEPNSKEIYDSPAVMRLDDHTVRVVIGSGGETRAGALHVLEFDETTATFTHKASVASGCTTGGYVASPVLADLEGDGVVEIIAADFCGRGIVISPTGQPRFTVQANATYGTANPTFIRHSQGVDVVFTMASANPSLGETIDIETSTIIRVSGQTGNEVFRTTVPTQAMATPSTIELTGDGVMDVLIVGMDFRLANEMGLAPLSAGLFVVDGATGELRGRYPYGNAASSPIVADVDTDGVPDVFVFDSLLDQVEPRALMRIELVGAVYDTTHIGTGFRGYPHHDGMF